VRASWFFPICNQPGSNGAFAATHQFDEDGAFDENDVMVPVSLPVVVVSAYPQQPALRQPDTNAPNCRELCRPSQNAPAQSPSADR
jgi:hypothetical protein